MPADSSKVTIVVLWEHELTAAAKAEHDWFKLANASSILLMVIAVGVIWRDK